MDPFLRQQATSVQPVESALAVSPNDSTDLVPPSGDPKKATRAIVVTGAGTVAVAMADGTTATVQVAAGILMPIAVKRIYSTGTTASGIVAFY